MNHANTGGGESKGEEVTENPVLGDYVENVDDDRHNQTKEGEIREVE